MKIVRIALSDLIYDGHSYRRGDQYLPEDNTGGDPPSNGDGFTIMQVPDDPGPDHAGGFGVGSRGSVGWRPQPWKPQAPPPTPEQLEQDRIDPFGLQRQEREQEEARAAAIREGKEKSEPSVVIVNTLNMTNEELDDFYGNRDAAAGDKAKSPEESS